MALSTIHWEFSKRKKKPTLDKWLLLNPDYKLELSHPMTVYLGLTSFSIGVSMMISH
jgi:hypothetical protein